MELRVYIEAGKGWQLYLVIAKNYVIYLKKRKRKKNGIFEGNLEVIPTGLYGCGSF